MNTWQFAYITFGLLTGLLVGGIMFKTRPARLRPIHAFAIVAFGAFGALSWPVMHIIMLVSLLLGDPKIVSVKE